MKWFRLLGKCLVSLLFISTLLLASCSEPSPSAPTQVPLKVVGLPSGDLFAPVPGSKFLMGSLEDEPLSRPDEHPRHEVILSTFFIMKHEVTNLEYQKCVQAGVCSMPLVKEEGPTSLYPDPQYGAWPVVGVDWFQAETYCQFINARLPTEAEWEKAARGREAFRFPWGNEDPACNLLNMSGCLEELDTEHVVAYKEGVSVYDLADMAGNVREWTADWYAPDYYPISDLYSPTGPAEGKLKVTRGGAWDDGIENVRTAARIPMDPKEKSEDVGFRCVPIVKTFAPFCNTTYRNFCDPGQYEDGDEPCDPQEQNDCGDYSVAGFGCPQNGVVDVNLFVPGGDAGLYNVTVGTDGFTCTGDGGTIYCSGPAQDMGTSVTITVCGPPPSESQQPTASTSASLPGNILLAAYHTPLLTYSSLQTASSATTGYCPAGYHFDEAEGACVVDEDRQPCPEGWHSEQKFDEKSQQDVLVCVLDDPLACPVGTTYDEARKGCVPVAVAKAEPTCPEGYELTEDEMCTPPFLWLSPCLPGYWFDTELGCCVPLENPCEGDTYFETLINDCLPKNPGGCPQCMYYDTYLGCLPIPECTPGEKDDSNKITQLIQLDCLEDDIGPNGECTPPPEGQCGEDYVYAPDTTENLCVPFYGPGSGCPEGYALDPRTYCCVPLENPCPDGKPDEKMQQLMVDTSNGTANPFFGVVFGDGYLNPYGGDCEGQQTLDGCPPGTTPNNDGGCVDDDSGGTAPQCPENCQPGTQDPYNCYCDPTQSNGCPPDDPCWEYFPDMQMCVFTCEGTLENGDTYNPCDSDDQVWIPELELCFPRGDDCCAPGYDWSAYYEKCMPIVQNFVMMNLGDDCQPGYEMVDNICLLIGRRTSEQCCWTVTVNVPVCVAGCEVGTTMVNGRCVKPEPEQPQQPTNPCPNCYAYNDNYQGCVAHSDCCGWDGEPTGGQGICYPKQ